MTRAGVLPRRRRSLTDRPENDEGARHASLAYDPSCPILEGPLASKDIVAAIQRTAEILSRRPSAAIQPDSPALARWVGGLKVEASGGKGPAIMTDVPAALGGAGEGVTPGWLARAALANCTATCIALAAARAGIALERLEAEVRTRSDTRGLLGLAGPSGPVDPGPSDVELIVRIAAPGTPAERLRALAADTQALSPLMSLFQHATPVTLSIEVDG